MSYEIELYNQYKDCIISECEYRSKLRNYLVQQKNLKEQEKQTKIEQYIASTSRPSCCDICCIETKQMKRVKCGHFVHVPCLHEAQKNSNKLFLECPYCRDEITEYSPKIDIESVSHIDSIVVNNRMFITLATKDNKQFILPKNLKTDFMAKILKKCDENKFHKTNNSFMKLSHNFNTVVNTVREKSKPWFCCECDWKNCPMS
jgi:hypothetical protein